MEPSTQELFTIAGGLIAAIGGPPAVVKGLRAYLDSRRHIKRIRDDNEKFKTEVRAGLQDIKHLKDGLQRLDANLRAQANLDTRPMFFACDEGKVTFVNREFTRQLGWTTEDMRDAGIVNAFHTDDQRRVATEWAHAVKDQRTFVTRARLQHADGTPLVQPIARVEALVMRCQDGTVYGWQGLLHLEDGK